MRSAVSNCVRACCLRTAGEPPGAAKHTPHRASNATHPGSVRSACLCRAILCEERRSQDGRCVRRVHDTDLSSGHKLPATPPPWRTPCGGAVRRINRQSNLIIGFGQRRTIRESRRNQGSDPGPPPPLQVTHLCVSTVCGSVKENDLKFRGTRVFTPSRMKYAWSAGRS